MDRLEPSAVENDWAACVGATYRNHFDSLRWLLARRLRVPQQVVEDALQDVFCSVLRLRSCPGRSREGALSFAYLCAAGQRRIQRVMQQRTRRQRRLEAGALREAIAGVSDESRGVMRTIRMQSTLPEDVEQAMCSLSLKQRDVLRMAFATVGSVRDEARMLGVSANCHAVEKHRAIAALRRALHVDCPRCVDSHRR